MNSRALIVVTAVFVVLAAVAVATQQNVVARKWQRDYQVQDARNHTLSLGLITTLAQASTLNVQVKSLTTQLSTVANEKEQALDHNIALTELIAAGAAVSHELSTCVDDMNNLTTEIGDDLSLRNYDDRYLELNAEAAAQICSLGQEDNTALQADLSGAQV